MMPAALLLHLLAIPAMAMYLLFALPAEGWRHVWKRAPLFLLLWLAFSLVTLVHVLGHLLDEILFFGYRRVTVKKPVFILGIPRSGTTYLQRLLAEDDRFTTLSTWEVLLAPSVSERYLYRLLGAVLAPLESAVIFLRRKLFRQMDTIHRIRLQEPEEDFMLFLPLLACLLLAFVCPNASHFWRLGKFDQRLPVWYRRTVMTFYCHCLQKHLYFQKGRLEQQSRLGQPRREQHDQDDNALVLLSKNPSFTPLTASLLERFPDGRIIACTRPPLEVIPSQLSALRPVMALLGGGMLLPDAQKKMLGLLYHYYAQLVSFQHHPRVCLQPMKALQETLDDSINGLFDFLGMAPSQSLLDAVKHENSKQGYASSHRYSLAEFGLTETDIGDDFADVWPLETGTSSRPFQPQGWQA